MARKSPFEGWTKDEIRKEMARRKNRGKDAQRRLAKLVGGKNVGSLSGEDVYHPQFSFEQKNLASFIGYSIMKQAEANCCGRIPVVVVKLKGERIDKDGLVIMRYNDFHHLIIERTPIVRKATT